MHYYFPGMIVGFILLQTAIVAPTLFKKLDIKDFGVVIRALWPKFFMWLTVFGVASVVDLYFHDGPSLSITELQGQLQCLHSSVTLSFQQRTVLLMREMKDSSKYSTKSACILPSSFYWQTSVMYLFKVNIEEAFAILTDVK
mgnify:CR=1 FL=1